MSFKATWHVYKTTIIRMTWDWRTLTVIMDCLLFRIFSLRYLLFGPSWHEKYTLQRDHPNCSPASKTNIRLQIHICVGFIGVHLPTGFRVIFSRTLPLEFWFSVHPMFITPWVKIERLKWSAYGKRKFWIKSIRQNTRVRQNHSYYSQKEGIRNAVLLKKWVYSGRIKSAI